MPRIFYLICTVVVTHSTAGRVVNISYIFNMFIIIIIRIIISSLLPLYLYVTDMM